MIEVGVMVVQVARVVVVVVIVVVEGVVVGWGQRSGEILLIEMRHERAGRWRRGVLARRGGANSRRMNAATVVSWRFLWQVGTWGLSSDVSRGESGWGKVSSEDLPEGRGAEGNFAQWRYRSQWSLTEARLLLVENYSQLPAQTTWNIVGWCNFCWVAQRPLFIRISCCFIPLALGGMCD